MPRLQILLALAAATLCGCASLAPSLYGVHGDLPGPATPGPAQPPAAALIGDIGYASAASPRLARHLARTLDGAPGVPVLVLGDVFYGSGLLGACPSEGRGASRRACAGAGEPAAQLEAVLGPYRDSLPANPLVAIAGNHDHYGDPAATENACRLIPAAAAGWRYLAQGCGLDQQRPLETLHAGALAIVILDSERMVQDAGFRAASVAALRRELSHLRRERPEAFIVVAAHHPLETYGTHNGAGRLPALAKDLYWLRWSLLAPVAWPLERLLVPWLGQQDVFEWRYRAFRRALYGVFEEHPIDLFAAGHDHNLQLVEIDHPGVRFQLVSGAGAKPRPLKRYGLDLFFTNRLARAVGLGAALPAPSHHLRFGAGPDGLAGRGYALLRADRHVLKVEFYKDSLEEPLYGVELARRRPPATAYPSAKIRQRPRPLRHSSRETRAQAAQRAARSEP